LGITEQTDALVVVVSEETRQISLVERARIVRNLDEPKLAQALVAHLHPQVVGDRLLRDETKPRRGAASVRELARRAHFGGWRRKSETPRKERAERRPPRVDPPRTEDDPASRARTGQ
jgi:hypothetical protein